VYTASWGSYIFERCHIVANQGLTAEIDWEYTPLSRCCRKFLIGAVVWAEETVVVRGNGRISTQNRKIPEMTVPISAVIDKEETTELLPLSTKRAELVMQKLIEYGVDPRRLSTRGLGSTEPVVAFTDAENRWKNRRVEFILIKE